MASQWRNIGSVLNRGYEALATVRLFDGEKLGVSVTGTGSTNTNRIERLGFTQAIVASSGLNVEGYPIYSRFAIPIVSYADANSNGVIEASEVTTGADPVYAGSSLPRHQLSLSPELTFLKRRLRVSAQFDYRGGFAQYNHSEANRCGVAVADCRAVNEASRRRSPRKRTRSPSDGCAGRTFMGLLRGRFLHSVA